jgi:phage terminase large subunit-like protein
MKNPEVQFLRSNSKARKIPFIDRDKIKNAERSELLEYYGFSKTLYNQWLKKQILENNRIDLLASEILDYIIKPFHLSMMQFQFLHPDNLQLVYRGSGKTSICTICKSVHLLLKDPNLRILIASKTTGNAESFLKEIKAHFEKNEKLIEIFGPYYDKNRKWDNREIEIAQRTKITKESTITCIGVDGTIVSKHYDIIFSDDLVDQNNSLTEYMREKTKDFYYSAILPTLEPPDPNVPHRGEHHRQGTRFHYNDLYGHLIENELKDHYQRIMGINKEGKTVWPEKHPPEWFEKQRKELGIIRFNAQYLCDAEAMKGKIFKYDDCQLIKREDLPKDLSYYMGVDLAIGEKEQNDNFVIVVIGKKEEYYYIVDFYEGQIRFSDQTRKIRDYYKRYDPIKAHIETNAYQEAQYQNLKDKYPDMRLKPKKQNKDKVSRAWKRSAEFDDKRVFVLDIPKSHQIIEHLVLFPDGPGSKDFFDAMDLAFSASKAKRRKRRNYEPGLLG